MRRKQENRYKISIEKELKLAERQEDALRRAAVKQEVPRWRTARCILRTPTYGFAKQNGRDAERAD